MIYENKKIIPEDQPIVVSWSYIMMQTDLMMSRLCQQIRSVKPEQAGIYKCTATNEYGNAVCNATLTVRKGKDVGN